MASPVYAAETAEQFRRLSEKNEGLELHAQLTKDELTRSASRWGLRHLLGFRLLTLPEKPFLKIIKGEHESCPLCYPERPCSQEIDPDWVAILTSNCHLDVLRSTDSQLLRLPGGFFWVALAQASRTEAVAKRKALPSERDGLWSVMGMSIPQRRLLARPPRHAFLRPSSKLPSTTLMRMNTRRGEINRRK